MMMRYGTVEVAGKRKRKKFVQNLQPYATLIYTYTNFDTLQLLMMMEMSI
jgi:hypothetical protein